VALIRTAKYGLYHLTNAGDCSWFEFAREIFRIAGVTADLAPITSDQFGAPARRPAYSVLANDKAASVGNAPPRPWKEAIRAYLGQRPSR
jgi:dTDP-4-dehydrorhamnose reductase